LKVGLAPDGLFGSGAACRLSSPWATELDTELSGHAAVRSAWRSRHPGVR
jgi:hypothetical protein